MANLNCPKCSSENTQKLSSVVAGGTSHSRSHSVGSVGGSIGGSPSFGMTSSTTNTSSQTVLAKKLAPPSKKPAILVAIVAGIVALTIISNSSDGFGMIIQWLLAGGIGYLGFVWFKKFSAYNKDEYPKLYAEWDKSFYCHRCDNVFSP